MEYDSTVASVRPIVWCAGCGHLILPFLIVAVGLDRRQNQTFARYAIALAIWQL
jgi:hypothetical protein